METITENGISAEDRFQVQTKTREFIIGSLGATRKGGGRNRNDTRVASTVRCNQGELS